MMAARRVSAALLSVDGLDEVGYQRCRVGSAQAGHWIPANGGRITGDGRVSLVQASGHVVEVGRVAGRVRADAIQPRIDQAERAAIELIGDSDDASPLWAAAAGAPDHIPAPAASRGAAHNPAVARRGDVHKDA